MVSIINVTWDHYALATRCLGPSLKVAGYDYELLSCDNGSREQKVIEYVASLKPVFHQLNSSNLGYAPCLNQMLLRAKGDYLCVLDPDIELPSGWLARLVECNQAIPNSGVCGVHCLFGIPEAKTINGASVRPDECVFGVKFFSRAVLDKVGYYVEEFSPYGLEDRDYLRRVIRSGFTNYYVDGLSSTHHGAGQTGEYRKLKDVCLEKFWRKFEANLVEYDKTGNYYVGPPKMLWNGAS